MSDPIAERHAAYTQRIRELEANLARMTAERVALLRDDALVAIKRNNDDLRERNDTLAAKLARCERLLLNVRDHGINAPMEQTIDDYFAASDEEPRT